jgi:phosphoribosyl-ATP pyrophosphohydrolase
MAETLKTLETIIGKRRIGDPALSYVAKLSQSGTAKIAQKVGEEATETVIAAMQGDPAKLTSEAADLIFHLLVLLADGGVRLEDVFAELDRREGTSGLAEKASRKE